jgi:hypothetical protein
MMKDLERYITTLVISPRLSLIIMINVLFKKIKRETPVPYHEDEYTEGKDKYKYRSEFVFGLGETKGPAVKNNMKFDLEGRDAIGYVMDTGGLKWSSKLLLEKLISILR